MNFFKRWWLPKTTVDPLADKKVFQITDAKNVSRFDCRANMQWWEELELLRETNQAFNATMNELTKGSKKPWGFK